MYTYCIYINDSAVKTIRTPVEKQQGLQTHKQGLTLSIAQNEGARCQALVIFDLK